LVANDAGRLGRLRRLVRTFARLGRAVASHATTIGYRLARFAALEYRRRCTTGERSGAKHVAIRRKQTERKGSKKNMASIAKLAGLGLFTRIGFIAQKNAVRIDQKRFAGKHAITADLSLRER